MTATIIPFRKRSPPRSSPVNPNSLDSLLIDLFARLDRMHELHYPIHAARAKRQDRKPEKAD